MMRWARPIAAAMILLAALTAGPLALAHRPAPEFATATQTAAIQTAPGAPAGKPNKDTYLIVVDKATQVVSVLRKDERRQYTVLVRQMRCSTGLKPNYTPEGTFRIYGKYRWLRAIKNQYVQYACRFNNHILLHSLSYSRIDVKTLITQTFTDLGKAVSAGCVRLSARDSKWIFDSCPNGTRVKVVKSGGPAATAVEPLPELPAGQTWDPTDPAIAPPAPASAAPGASPSPLPANS